MENWNVRLLLPLAVLCLLPSVAWAEAATVLARGGLNCRAKANAQSNIEGTIPYGSTVDVLRRSGNWLQVRCPNGRMGFIYRRFVIPGARAHSAPQNTAAISDAPASCSSGEMRRTSKVTHYFVPTLRAYNDYVCRRMEGTCYYKKNGVDMIYNVGIGAQVRSQAQCPYGWGSRGNCLNPCKSVAADLRYHAVGDRLYFPALRGQICQGQVHDGWVTVGDKGSAIQGADRFDFFWGECANRGPGDTCKDSGRTGSPQIIQRILTGANYCKGGQSRGATSATPRTVEASSAR